MPLREGLLRFFLEIFEQEKNIGIKSDSRISFFIISYLIRIYLKSVFNESRRIVAVQSEMFTFNKNEQLDNERKCTLFLDTECHY